MWGNKLASKEKGVYFRLKNTLLSLQREKRISPITLCVHPLTIERVGGVSLVPRPSSQLLSQQ